MLQELPASSSFFPPHVRRLEHERNAANAVNYQCILLGYKEVSDEKA
jgi:hypothetical protein